MTLTLRCLDLVPRAASTCFVLLWVLLIVPGRLVFAQQTDGVEETYTALDSIDLGEQLSGERLSRHDLVGKVVVCFHWCITCPISTGAFPYVNRLVKRYRDRGVFFIGFQVPREPALETNNVVYYLDYLKPDFPVTRRGWVTAWPVKYLPWAMVFNHKGEKIFAANLPGLEKTIQAALAEAPDYLAGGPYEHLRDLAARIVGDRDHLRKPLVELRALVRDDATEPRHRAEAGRMLACLERYHRHQVAKAEEDAKGPVERATLYERLARMYHGDRLGEQAASCHREIVNDPAFAREREAQAQLDPARVAFQKLPPAGRYTYDMHYILVRKPAYVTRRVRTIAAYLAGLRRIESAFPKTHAASLAVDLRLDVELPELESEGARQALAEARRVLAAETTSGFARYDAYLQLYHVVHGYHDGDETAEQARKFHDDWMQKNAGALEEARIAHERLTAATASATSAIRVGGSGLTPDEARPHLTRLAAAAAEAGECTRLAREIETFVADLKKSFAGPASLGVAFARGGGEGLARIRWVYPRSAAIRAGLEPGDVIVAFDGREGPTPAAIREALKTRKPGERVVLRIQRGSPEPRSHECTVILGRQN
jgi:PDZ domain-containing protein